MEAKVQTKIKEKLESFGAWCFKAMKSSKGGTSDLIACLPITITKDMVGKKVGLFVAIEVKDLGKISTTKGIQHYQIKKVKQAGGVGLVADNLGKVMTELEEMGLI